MAIKEITKENFHEFKLLMEKGLENFIPMLPFVKSEFQEFGRYLKFNDRAIYVIDEISETENCIYHFFTLPDSKDLLRVTLILPSNFDNRIEIAEKSLENIKGWLNTKGYNQFMVQTLEHGEIEYYPTLSNYLLPILIKLGFKPHYRVYLTIDNISEAYVPQNIILPTELQMVNYTDGLKDKVIDFYFNEPANGYYNPFTYTEFIDAIKCEEFARSARFIIDANKKVVGGIFSGHGSFEKKIWIDGLKVSNLSNEEDLALLLIISQIELAQDLYSNDEITVYLSREYQKHIKLFETFGFYGFEFWVDAILDL